MILINLKKFITILLLCILFIILIYSIIKIIDWKKDSDKTKNEIDYLQEVAEVNDNENNNKNEENSNSENENINFENLEKINPDVVAWIKVNETNINYPVVKGKDNEFYLNHSFKKEFNNAGWVFLDYRNDIADLSKNSIIYAHNRQDGTMFGTLKNTLDEEWKNNERNLIIKMNTKNNQLLWKVFSIYTTTNTEDYLQTDFKKTEDFEKFIQILLNRSKYNYDTNVENQDKILTLSSCYINSKQRIVLHAKLLK